MKVALGKFACSGIKAHAGGDLQAAVHAALSRYTSALESESGQAPIPLPPFCRDQQGPQDAEVAFDISVDRNSRELLEREAARQNTTVSQLAVHSVLAYLAELDFQGTSPRVGAAGV